MDPVVHFELPAGDRSRMVGFYEKAFGWQAEQLGPEMGNYTVVTTTQTVDGRPAEPGAINGGFFEAETMPRRRRPRVVIGVADARLAGGRHRSRRDRRRRADDDPGRGAVRELPRHRGQPPEHPAADGRLANLPADRRRAGRQREVPPWRTTRTSRPNPRGWRGEAPLAEKRMFGGLAFLVDGKMAVAAGSGGGECSYGSIPRAPRRTCARPCRADDDARPPDGWLGAGRRGRRVLEGEPAALGGPRPRVRPEPAGQGSAPRLRA